MYFKLKTIILFLIITCQPSHQQIRKCDDCQPVKQCAAADDAVSKKDNESIMKLRKAFCGYHEITFEPMICCFDFVQPVRVTTEESTISKHKHSLHHSVDDNTIDDEDDVDIDEHPNLGLLPEKCGKIDEERIVGGSTAKLYEFPWMVLIFYGSATDTNYSYKCSGSLINDRYVLTAAHCIKRRNVAGVRVGEYNIATVEDCVGVPPKQNCERFVQDRLIKKKIIHEHYLGFGEARGHDIALLRLDPPIKINESIKNAGTICLPITRSLRHRDVSYEPSVVAGWGVNDNNRLSKVLRRVLIKVYSAEECQKYSNLKDVNDDYMTVLCAGEEGKDSCNGDSGSPLMIEGVYKNNTNTLRYVQYGIVSHGPSECGTGAPGVYTDVSKYVKWILDNIEP